MKLKILIVADDKTLLSALKTVLDQENNVTICNDGKKAIELCQNDKFDLITHAENSTYCKGNSKYWMEILEKIGGKPEDSLVIGNDGIRDMSAKRYGFKTFLIEENLENEELMTDEIKPDYKGSLRDLHDLLLYG